MNSITRLMIAGVGAAAVVMAGAGPAGAQTREARGTVTAVSERTITVKAGAQELTFLVDSQTRLEVGSTLRQLQQARAGSPSPRVSDFFKAGEIVLVRYREESGNNHALDIRRVTSTGGAGGSVSVPEKIADGKVKAITHDRLVLEGQGRDLTFAITGDTGVLARGATKATRAAGGGTPITTFVHAGDTVSVSYRDAGGQMIASEVRVRIAQK